MSRQNQVGLSHYAVGAVDVGNADLGGMSRQNQVGFSYHTMQLELLVWGMLSLEACQDRIR